MANTLAAVFENNDDAQNAYNALVSAGFSGNNIQLSSQEQLSSQYSSSPSTRTTTAPVDDSFGGRISHFFSNLFGSDEDNRQDIDTYSEAIRRGHAMVIVHPSSDEESQRASDILNRFNPVNIDERASQWRSSGWSGFDQKSEPLTGKQIQQDRKAIPVIQEELQIGKRAVERGGVRVHQRVTEKPVEESVQLHEERVKVERRPVNQPASEADLAAIKEGSFEIRETAEEPVVAKSARVVEEVRVGKEATERTETVRDTVRRTDVEVEQINASATSRLSDDSDFRKHWQTTYGTSGGRYEDYDDAYRYGYNTMANDRYRDTDWDQAEPELRNDWESDHPGSTWDKVKDAVRYGAERVSGHRPHH